MKVIHFPFALIMLALLFGCSGDITMTESDQGKTINVAPGQTITLTLNSNATTGFKWNLVTEPDAKVLKLVSSQYNPPIWQIPGAGGTETWKFQAVGAGSTTIKLSYFRPFDPKQVGDNFVLNIFVK